MKILSSIPHEELLGDHPKPVFCDHIVYSLEDIKERKSKILTNINHQKQQEEQSHKEPTLAFEETKDTNTDLNDLTISNHDAETQTYLLQEISNLNLSDKEYIIESHNNGTMDIIGD